MLLSHISNATFKVELIWIIIYDCIGNTTLADVYCIIVLLNVKIILFMEWHFITYLTWIKGQFFILFLKQLI